MGTLARRRATGVTGGLSMNALFNLNMQHQMRDAEAIRMAHQERIKAIAPAKGTLEYIYLQRIFKQGRVTTQQLRADQEKTNYTMPGWRLKRYIEAGFIGYERQDNRGGTYWPEKNIRPEMLGIDVTEH